MRITCISDMHGNLPKIEPCDLLLIAGDITPANNHSIPCQADWLSNAFSYWLKHTPAKDIVGVAGNHDFIFQRKPDQVTKHLRWTYLQDELAEVQGLKIWGSPWQNWFYDWAFNAPHDDGEAFLDSIYKGIPEGTDIIISHGPPSNCENVDRVPPALAGSPNAGQHVGSKSLWKHINRVKPKLVVTGHIHSGRIGSPVTVPFKDGLGFVTVVNASFIDENYNPAYTPIELEWNGVVKQWSQVVVEDNKE